MTRYLVAALVIALLPALLPNPFYIQLLQDVCVTTIAAIGLNWLVGLSGQMSLGHAAFFALGAYGSAIAASKFGLPLWVGMPVGIVVAAVAGGVVGLVALRAKTHYLAMVTLAFGFIVEILSQRWVAVTGGSMGMMGLPQLDFGNAERGPSYFLWSVAGTVLALQIVNDYMMQTRIGRALQAVKESESFALTVGIHVSLWRAGIFVVSAALAGLAGAFFAHQSNFISSDTFGLSRSIELLIVVVIGGRGKAYGPLLGALILTLFNQWTASLYEFSAGMFGLVLLAVMLFCPDGVAGLLERLVDRFKGNRRERREGTLAQPQSPTLAQVGATKVATGPAVLVVEAVSKRYGGLTAVDAVTFSVAPASIHALIGPNGAGKSTLINVLSGLFASDGGRIHLCGQEVTKKAAWRRARLGLARTFQNIELIGTLTAVENVMLGMQTRHGLLSDFASWMSSGRLQAADRAAAVEVLRELRIAEYADVFPHQLSYGHRKLVELARALGQQPTVMLLDEPIAGLNDEEAREIASAVKVLAARGVAILVVEHNMNFVMDVCEVVTVLDFGQLIGHGTPAEVKRNTAVIKAYLGEATTT